MSHLLCYTIRMTIKNDMKENDKATYTLWNGSQLIATYPHTREGSDAAFARAFELGVSAAIYSSRDDLIWSAKDDDENAREPNSEEMDFMDSVYADADTLSGAGWGTNEDYGCFE